jgi:hypothetical protein
MDHAVAAEALRLNNEVDGRSQTPPPQAGIMRMLTLRSRGTLSRFLVVLATMLTPLIGGAFIYYSLRKTHPRTADFANLLSVAGFAAWTSVMYSDWARHDGRVLLAVLGSLGVIASELAVRISRSLAPECEQASQRTASTSDRGL